MTKPKLLWVSDSPLWEYVGQSKVTREMCRRLSNHFEVTVAGFYERQKVGQEQTFDGYRVINIYRDQTDLIIDAIHKSDPDVVLLSHDCWEFPKLATLRHKFPKVKFVGYFTIDCEPLDRKWKAILDSCHLIVSPTEYGKRIIQDQFFYLDVDVVPYGIDHSLYHNLEAAHKENLREQQQLIPHMKGKFCAFYIGQNYTRKNLGGAMDGWLQFVNRNDDANDKMFVIITHTRTLTKGEWKDLPTDYDLADWTHPTLFPIDQIVKEQEVAMFHQMSDVLILPSVGEGFGLPILEAMATGSIPIVSNFSGHTDFCNEHNSMPLDGVELWAQLWHTKRMVVGSDKIADALETLYGEWKNEPHKFYRRAQSAVMTARQYEWDKAADLMHKSLTKVVTGEIIDRANRVFRL